MTSPLDRAVTQPAARTARSTRGHRLIYLAATLVLVGLGCFVAVFLSYRAHTTDQLASLDRRANVNASAAQQLAQQVRRLGGTPVVQPPVASLSTAPGLRGISPTDVHGAVADYFAEHPPEPGPAPTTAQVTRVVASVLATHPPAPGRAPTPAEVATAVAGYCGADACRGPQGPGPTAEQIAQAVTTYCATGACLGPAGPTGPAGPPGPADASCPEGYEFRPVVALTADGGGYADAVQCVRPDSTAVPTTTEPPPPTG